MMNKILVALLLSMSVSLAATAQKIAYVKSTSAWYYAYDADGKKLATLSTNVGELVGYCSSFMVVKTSAWYYLYNAKGKKYKSLSLSYVGEVVAVSADTFTSRLGDWIYTWDKDGKKIHTQSAK